MESLDNLVAEMHVTGGIFLDAEFTAPWCVSSSIGPDERQLGVRDPRIASALVLLHEQLARRWTAKTLAVEVGLSRSAFADRFSRLMGEPPMRYLARQRLRTASERLKTGGDSIARIAFLVGYESEAAFNRAFKREFGVPPATWRKQGRDAAPSPLPGEFSP